MNHLLSETFHIDTEIQRIQTDLYGRLTSEWNMNGIDGYGRIYRNERDTGTVAEVFNAGMGEYRDVYYNDRSCFFFIDDQDHDTKDGHLFTAKVKIVFMLNLKDISNSSERADAKAQRDVVNVLWDHVGTFSIKGLEKGVDNVLKGFSTDALDNNDMHPFHIFGVTGELEYEITKKCD